jgi:hypothetical protein
MGDAWRSLPEWLTALVAIVALLFAWFQIRSNEKVAGNAAALSAWRDYLAACTKYTEYSSHPLVKNTLPSRSTKDIEVQDSIESERYLWFLSTLLLGCEQVLLHASDADGWWPTMTDQISYHWPSFVQLRGPWAQQYDARVLRLIDDGIARGRSEFEDWVD